MVKVKGQNESKPKRAVAVSKPTTPSDVVAPPKGRYINPLTDFGFKRIFGNSLILKDFLNNVLELDDKIVRLRYQNVEQKGRTKNDRSSVFDLQCTTSKGEYIIIEMQNLPQLFFFDRAVYYMAIPIQKQAKKGKWDFKLKPVYMVCLLNHKIGDDEEDSAENDKVTENAEVKPKQYHSKIQLVNVNTNRVAYKKLALFFIELSEFDKTEEQLETDYDWWLYILKNITDLQKMPDKVKRNRVFKALFEEAHIANMTPEELDQYDISLKKYLNNMTATDVVKSYKRELASSKKELATQGRTLKVYINTLAEKDNTLAEKDNALAEKDKIIADLRKQLGLN